MTVAPFNPMERLSSTGGDQTAQLLSARYGSSGSYIVVRHGAPTPACGGSWGGYVGMPEGSSFFPFIGTSPVVDNRRLHAQPSPTRSPAEYPLTLTLSVPEQLGEALAALSLNKSQLADVLGVTRPTLYEWLDSQAPSPAKADRLFALMRLLARLGVSSGAPLNARFVRQPLDEAGDSLLSRFGEAAWDERRIEALVTLARALDQSAADKLAGREVRLREMGYEELNAEQRRTILAQNLAASDWPT